jgi:hypothetical protein
LDRDTERFRLILDYLRDGELKRGLTEDTLFALLIEVGIILDYLRDAELKKKGLQRILYLHFL